MAVRRVLIFDGVCNLCNGVVQFVIKRDPAAKIKFCALQSQAAKPLLQEFGISEDDALKSFAFVEGDKCYRASTAAIQLARQLTFPLPLLSAAYVLPAFVRDPIYYFVATRRYSWFGKTTDNKKDDDAGQVCLMPKPDVVRRFLDAEEKFPAAVLRRAGLAQ